MSERAVGQAPLDIDALMAEWNETESLDEIVSFANKWVSSILNEIALLRARSDGAAGDGERLALTTALAMYEADPVDARDRPSSWGKLAALLDAARAVTLTSPSEATMSRQTTAYSATILDSSSAPSSEPDTMGFDIGAVVEELLSSFPMGTPGQFECILRKHWPAPHGTAEEDMSACLECGRVFYDPDAPHGEPVAWMVERDGAPWELFGPPLYSAANAEQEAKGEVAFWSVRGHKCKVHPLFYRRPTSDQP